MKRWLLIAVLTSLLFTGCAGQSKRKQLEQLGVISASGYDLGNNGDLLGSVVLPNFTETGKEQIDVLSAVGHTSKQLRFNMSRLSERNLVSGQIRVVLYGEDLAKRGILQLSDTLFRDSEIGSQIHLAVVDGRAVDYFTKRYPDKPSVDIYLYKMIRKEMEQNTIPKSNLHRFISMVYDTGSDPILPYLRAGKEDVVLDGLAVFRDDKFVGRIDAEMARYLAYAMGGTRNGEIDAELSKNSKHGDQEHVVLMYLKMKRNLEAQNVNGHPKFILDFVVEGGVTEYTGSEDLEDEKSLRRLEQVLATHMKDKMLRLLDLLQNKYGADPVGFGEFYRAKGLVSQLDADQWHELYKKSEFEVNVQVKILQTGMIH